MAVSGQGPNLDPSGQVGKVVFPEKSGQDIGFHEKSQGEFVLFSQQSEKFFLKRLHKTRNVNLKHQYGGEDKKGKGLLCFVVQMSCNKCLFLLAHLEV